MEGDSPKKYSRMIGSEGQTMVHRLGMKRHFWSDLYHFFLKISWFRFTLITCGAFLAVNALFALLYLQGGNVIENARPGSFEDVFFFSVQTIATIGYGKMAPFGLYANSIVTLEVLTGLVSLTLMTGLILAKFARPSARILFSRTAVITPYEGVPSLMFRMANERSNRVVQAQLQLSLLKNEITKDGLFLRRFHDMKLVRSQTPIFGLSWLAIHPIDKDSPLYNQDHKALLEQEAEIVASFTGTDDTFLQSIHKQHSYIPDEIIRDAQFEDVFSFHSDGSRKIDFNKFHQVKRGS